MQITFYINTSPTNKVNKSLTSIKSINIDIYEMVDVVNPVIRVDRTDIPSEANYMVCGEPLNRRYFITAMDFTNAKTTVIAGHVDVLSTYHGFLENTVLNYVRGEGDINEMDDSSYPISDYLVEQYFPMSDWTDIFSNRGNGRQYLLRTISGNPKQYPSFSVSNGTVFWDGTTSTYSDGQGGIITRYNCYVITINGNVASAQLSSRDDPTGLIQLMDKYYIEANSKMWQFHNNKEQDHVFTYLGDTT